MEAIFFYQFPNGQDGCNEPTPPGSVGGVMTGPLDGLKSMPYPAPVSGTVGVAESNLSIAVFARL